MENKLVSVILVNWNGMKWLDKCLKSLMDQTYNDFEIILVDNDSSDGSVEFVQKNFPNVRVIVNKSNLGFASGNNIGINNAKGEYILLLNNDTWMEKDFLSNMLKFYRNNRYDVIAPREVGYDGKKQSSYISKIDPFGHPVYLFGKREEEAFYLVGVCLFFNKKIYKETGGFDDNFFMYCEEVDWFWRLNLLKKKFTYVDSIYIFHAGAGSTGEGIKYKVFLWRNQNTLQMLLKNYKWYSLLWVLSVYLLQNIVEILFFLILLKPKISLSYIQGWWFNIRNINSILKKRKLVQKDRKLNDLVILRKMYLGFGKLKHLIAYNDAHIVKL
jgi:hypothetical protein